MDEATHVARRLSALVGMGFERVETSPVATEAARLDRRTHKVTSRKAAMGTLVSVTALARSRARTEEAIGRAFEEMDRLIGIFSRFEPSSAVAHLNDTGRLRGAPPEFAKVLSQSLLYHELSGGVFDVSVEPIVRLFRHSPEGVLPSERDVREALSLVGARRITLSRADIGFERTGMGITLDGIAKGYIVDAIAATLERHKIKSYLIDGGGDVRASGTKAKRQPWTIAVQDPSKNDRFPDLVHLTNASVATSGSYEVYFDRERRHHHIVNSQTGRSPIGSQSVSVMAPSAMAADALATTVFLMDPDDGIEFVGRLPGCECLIVDREGLHLKTRGWRSAAAVH
jgi:thiamine biosynthesis lipoprotein